VPAELEPLLGLGRVALRLGGGRIPVELLLPGDVGRGHGVGDRLRLGVNQSLTPLGWSLLNGNLNAH